MTIQERKSHLVEVGNFLRQFSKAEEKGNLVVKDEEPYYDKLNKEISFAIHHNGWFTRENILYALEEWSKALTEENLSTWLQPYDLEEEKLITVGLILAGNIPLVGFHDFISVLVSGNKVLVKLSSNDQKLLPIIASYLIAIEPEYNQRISFTEGRMNDFDAVIATGSNNTARYFEYYFASKPSIIRKNRNSVAVLTGNEKKEQLEALGEDIFRYFGLGCRNVSKLYVPLGYDFHLFYQSISHWEHLLNHAKYANNYDYNKAVYLMSEFKFLDNGFLVVKEDDSFGSPIATLFYETYQDYDELLKQLEEKKEQLQCVVAEKLVPNAVPFGHTQKPELNDYADNVDTIAFLQQL